MHFKPSALLALAAAFPLTVTAGCNSGIDTTVGASCSDEGDYACANTNTRVVQCTGGTWQLGAPPGNGSPTCGSDAPTCIYCECQGPGAGAPPPPPPRRLGRTARKDSKE